MHPTPSSITPVVTVDLAALCANYRLLKARHARQDIAAVVKADAYGLGMVHVARALWEREACRRFFVATLDEASRLRQALPEAEIHVFQGPFAGEERDYAGLRLRPVLNSREQLERWRAYAAEKPPAVLHVDTGMCRLGLSIEELPRLGDTAQLARELPLSLLMSHLACAGEPEHPLNQEQQQRFDEARRFFPGLAASLANSSAHFLGAEFHYELGRPGCALYGITPNPDRPNPMQSVASWTAPIIQLRSIERDQPIGYGATRMVTRGMTVATVASGYADGLHRTASNRLPAWIGEHRCEMLGRVSMDLTCYDVTGVPQTLLQDTTRVTLMGPQQPVDQLAEQYGTIGYEVLCHLGPRVRRDYIA